MAWYPWMKITMRIGKHYVNKGFTLIEVLLALAIIAIALTALISVTARNVENTQRLKEKTLRHWVAVQGLTMVQLGLIKVIADQDNTEKTILFGQSWYWRVRRSISPIAHVEQITITTSTKQNGPFMDPLLGYMLKNDQN